jgi:hypothetical protein
MFNFYFVFLKKEKLKWQSKTLLKRNVNKNLLLIWKHFLEFILWIKCNVKNSNYNQTIYIKSIF